MAALSTEEENYVRFSLLLNGISPCAVRVYFDQEFPPTELFPKLKNELEKLLALKLKRVISQTQWDLLFPHEGDPDSKTFDVGLMILLIRYLTSISPVYEFDKLPSENETFPPADLARIKYYRDKQTRHVGFGIDTSDFHISWTHVADAVGRLGGLSLHQQCEELKVKPLLQPNKEILLEMKNARTELKHLKEEIDSMSLELTDLKKVIQPVLRNITFGSQEDIWNPNQEMEDRLESIFIGNLAEIKLMDLSMLRENMFRAIEFDSTKNLNKLLLESNKEMCLLLLPNVFERAVAQTKTDAIKMIAKLIVEEFKENSKTALDNASAVWLGTKCSCKKHFPEYGVMKLCESNEYLIVIEEFQQKIDRLQIAHTFLGFDTRVVNVQQKESSEADLVNEYTKTSKKMIMPDYDVNYDVDYFFNRHSNLTIMCPASMKSTGFGSDHNVFPLKCIELFCRVKAFIPAGEPHFPTSVGDLPTDILQATPYLVSSFKVGDKIARNLIEAEKYSTMGGFVKYYGLPTFLTCAHSVLQLDDEIKSHHNKCHKIFKQNDTRGESPENGILIQHRYGDCNGTSIDAALVYLNNQQNQAYSTFIEDFGFINDFWTDELELLNNPESEWYAKRETQNGANCEGKGGLSYSKNPAIRMIYLNSSIVMKKQIIVHGLDAEPGHSGTCIYIKEKGCIGMIVDCL